MNSIALLNNAGSRVQTSDLPEQSSGHQSQIKVGYCKRCECEREFTTSLRRQPTGLFRVYVCRSCGNKFAARLTKNRPK